MQWIVKYIYVHMKFIFHFSFFFLLYWSLFSFTILVSNKRKDRQEINLFFFNDHEHAN
jgi:hypothetical protein